MKKIIILSSLLLVAISIFGQSQFEGRWVTIDDKSGEKRSVVTICKGDDGLYYGRIDYLFNSPQNILCETCKGDEYNQPVVGLTILRSMKYEDGILKGGRLLDPESGNWYYSKISYDEETQQLKIRGSIDKRGFIGRSQFWSREN